jgi:hypothetical protein
MSIRYELPPAGKCYDEWLMHKAPHFSPTPRQKLVMDAAARAIDSGLFYNVDVNAAVAKDLGVTAEQLARNTQRVDGGDFGYDVYFARGAVEAHRYRRMLAETAAALSLKPGDKVGTLIFNDGKRTTGAVVETIGESGVSLVVQGKRAGKPIGLRCNVEALARAIRTAQERGARKDTYEEFRLARLRLNAGPLTPKVAERLVAFAPHELGEAEILLALRQPGEMAQPVHLALQALAESIDMAAARGEDCMPCFDDVQGELERLLEASPWTMHPDHGCVLAADVEELDRQAAPAPH